MLACRFAIGALFLYIAKKVKKEPKITAKEKIQGTLLGIVVFIGFALQTYGAKYTTPGKNGMLTGIYVLFVPLIIMVLSKRFRVKPLLDALICLIGMAIFFELFKEALNINLGDVLTIACALAFAIQFIVLEKYAPRLNPWNYTFVQLIAVSGISILCSVFIEWDSYKQIDMVVMIVGVLLLGVFSTGFAYLAQTIVQAKIKATTVSIIACSESIFAMIFALIFGYEMFSYFLVIGALVILISMISSTLGSKKDSLAYKVKNE